MTFPRIRVLLDVYDENQRLEMYAIGSATALGFNEPKKLKQFLKSPKQEVQATGMLAIPKKREENGELR